ncbi:hypothetical protein JKP88DRAFT_265952 [Tribonema minus]|uniref:Uncharacterized protein n=1 Tax=Tribonema minus TaxID=303371 RepID=A0A835YQ01_9STRA|nr:hypothetical protein JKP88DRAFT_265952 [Tribonema minus]
MWRPGLLPGLLTLALAVCLGHALQILQPPGPRLCRASGTILMTARGSSQACRRAWLEAAAVGLTGVLAGAGAAEAAAGSVEACPPTGNCISTASFKVLDKYAAPWDYTATASTGAEAFDQLKKAAEKDSLLRVLEADAGRLYLHCEAKSGVGGDMDDFEFVVKPGDGLVTFSSKSRSNVTLGPVTVSDGGAMKNRLETLRYRLGWPSAGQAYEPVVPKRRSYFDSLKGAKSSYGEDETEDTIDY